MPDFGLGNKIGEAYNTSDAARKAAREHSGNEAIVREKNGTFSLYKISDSIDEENSILTDEKSVNRFLKSSKSSEIDLQELVIDNQLENKNFKINPMNPTGLQFSINRVFELGEKKGGSFDALDGARNFISEKKLNAFIVKEPNGTYSVHNIESDDKLLKNDSLRKDYLKFEKLRIVEFGNGTTNNYHFERQENKIKNTVNTDKLAPKTEEMAKDLSKTGEKISDLYIDNSKENKFIRIEEAEAAAKLYNINYSKGNKIYANSTGNSSEFVAIRKNADESYSLYSVSEQQYEKIKSEGQEYKGNIYGFVKPDLVGNQDLEHISEEKKGSGIEVLKQDLKNATQILKQDAGDFITTDAGSQEINRLQEMQSKASKIQGLEQLKAALDGMNNGMKIDASSISNLETAYNLIKGQMDSGQLNLTEDEKKIVGEFSTAITSLKSNFNKYQDKVNSYNQNLEKINAKANLILEAAKDIPENSPQGKLIIQFFQNYSNVMNGDDRFKQALYQTMMDSFLSVLNDKNSKGNRADKLNAVLRGYVNIENMLMKNQFDAKKFELYANQMITDKDKDDKDAKILNLKSLFNSISTGALKTNMTDTTKQRDFEVVEKPPGNEQPSGNGVTSGNEPPNPANLPARSEEYKDEVEVPVQFTDDSLQSFRQSLEHQMTLKGESLDDVLRETEDLNEDLFDQIVDVIGAEVELTKSVDKVVKLLKDPKFKDTFESSLKNAINTIQKEDNKDKSEKNKLNEIIEKVIKKARLLQDKMSLTMNTPKEAQLSTFLSNLRRIIANLDLETRELINKKLSSKIIDQNFSKFIKENQDKIKISNELREQLNNIFNESKEIKVAKMPLSLKQEKMDDISEKFILIALNQVK